jgi:hypothetical protein
VNNSVFSLESQHARDKEFPHEKSNITSLAFTANKFNGALPVGGNFIKSEP